MNDSYYKKGIVLGIIVLFVGTCVAPSISGTFSKISDLETNKKISNENIQPCEQIPKSSFNFFILDNTGKKQCNVVLPLDDANDIYDIFEELKYKIVNEPYSLSTQEMKNNFVELLNDDGLLSNDVKKEDIHSLLNPSVDKFTKDNYKTGSIGNRLLYLLSRTQGGGIGRAFMCSVASAGSGFLLPFIIIPRPHAVVLWITTNGITSVGEYMTNEGFIAGGKQNGFAIGFEGVGLTYSIPGEPLIYGFIGGALYTMVNAEEIEYYPENLPPSVSAISPVDGAEKVSLSTNELIFRIEDPNGDLMRYTVTTNPDVGEGEGIAKPDGTYSIPISGLEESTKYTWTVEVTDGKNEVEESYTFTTESESPIVYNPDPSNDARHVSVDLSQLSFSLKDFQGDLMDYTVETVPDIESEGGNMVGDGTYTCDVSGLDYSTVYYWFVNVTDGDHWKHEIFNFQTELKMVFDPFDEGWQYRKKITIDHNMVDGDLVDFPVLVSTIDSDLRDNAQNDGDDILFMDGGGVANRLYHEIESFDGSSGELITWVKIPGLNKNTDTVIYIYYGNPNCDSQQYPEKVWDEEYCAIWHLDDLRDSTNNYNHGTNYGTNNINGKIGNARNFVRSQEDNIDWGDMPEPADDSNKKTTFEIWINPVAIHFSNPLIYKKNSAISPARLSYALKISDEREIFFKAYSGKIYPDGRTITFESENQIVTTGTWQYIAVVVDLSSQNMEIYYNGNEEDCITTIKGTPPAFFYDIDLNEESGVAKSGEINYYDGSMDEIRISKTCRSRDWISTGYNNQNDPSSFFSVGPEESAP